MYELFHTRIGQIVLSRVVRIGGALAVVAGLFLIAGCGGNRVAGKVTLNGTPVKGGIITFHGEGQNKKLANINSEGEYSLEDPPEGTVKVSVHSLQMNIRMPRARIPAQASLTLPPAPAAGATIPWRYADPNNGLTLMVTGGAQRFDVDLMP
jgi:hypothetical protein